MRASVAPLFAVSLAAGCAHAPIDAGALTPLAREHLREGFRRPLSGSAVLLPILDCAAHAFDVIEHAGARQAATTWFSHELWRALGAPGEVEDGRLPESDRLCQELSQNHESGTNAESASAVMRELLRGFFYRHPGKHWLVAAVRTLRFAERVPGEAPGQRVGALASHVLESETIEVSLYVFGRHGELAFRGDMACSTRGKDERYDCGPTYQKAALRIAELVEGFPRSILRNAAVIKIAPHRTEHFAPESYTEYGAPLPPPADEPEPIGGAAGSEALPAEVEPAPSVAPRPRSLRRRPLRRIARLRKKRGHPGRRHKRGTKVHKRRAPLGAPTLPG